jgi:flagellar biosynthesis protein FlhG
MKRLEDLNYYELLNIEEKATEKEIKDAYMSSILQYHSDSIASYGLLSDKEKILMLKRVEEAYRTLIDASRKKHYDNNILKLDESKESDTTEPQAKTQTTEKEKEDKEVIINGKILKNIRELKGITLSDISKKTKIGLNYLEAIEEDNYKLFPAEIFLRGFLKSYVKCLGLEPKEILKNHPFFKLK